jgi:hypothetical protein
MVAVASAKSSSSGLVCTSSGSNGVAA